MRILALNWRDLEHPQSGGSEKNLFEQATRWVAAGHDVTVFTARPRQGAAPTANVHGVKVLRRAGRFGVYAAAARYLVRNGSRYDVVLDVANGVPFFAPLFTRTPVVLLVHHVHGAQWRSELGPGLGHFGRLLEERVVPRLYRREVVAVSPTTRDALVEIGFRRDRVNVVFNGVDTARGGAATAEAGSARVAYVGRVRRYKRLEKLIDAVARISQRHPAVLLDIAGDGDARPALERQIAALGMEDRVRLRGWVDESTKGAILRGAAVFATPSMHEGWGLSVIEANAHGVPAVAFDVPGLRNAIRHGETGYLATSDSEFEGAIERLLTDRAEQRRVAREARRWASSFSWERCARETMDVLQRSAAART